MNLKDEKRFRALCVKDALSEISADELMELEGLQIKRRLDHPPTNEELTWRRRIAIRDAKLLAELKRHVEFQ